MILIYFLILLFVFHKQIDRVLVYFLYLIRVLLSMESYEDLHHSDKKQSTNLNEYLCTNIQCKYKSDYKYIVKKLKHNELIQDYGPYLIPKYHKKKRKCEIYANHSKVNGFEVFNLLLNILDVKKSDFIQTSILKGFIHIPQFLYKNLYLNPVNIERTQICQKIYKKQVIPKSPHIKYVSLYETMKEIYEFLNLKDTMYVLMPFAFNEDKHVKNNVGIMIIEYTIGDTPDTIRYKMNVNKYQLYTSNILLHIPLRLKNFDIRRHIHCVITNECMECDKDIQISWFPGKAPIEPVYCAVLTQIKKDKAVVHKSFTTNVMNIV